MANQTNIRDGSNFSWVKDPNRKVTPKNIQSWREYKQWYKFVMARSDKCQKCGIMKRLEAHHIKPVRVIFQEHNIITNQDALDCEELWDINNGMVVCIRCHKYEDHIIERIAGTRFKSNFPYYKDKLADLLELDVPRRFILRVLGLDCVTMYTYRDKIRMELCSP